MSEKNTQNSDIPFVIVNNEKCFCKIVDNKIQLFLCGKKIQSLNDIKGIENISDLKYLNLNNNHLTNLDGIENFTSLESIDLSFNSIETIHGIGNLISIKSINLYNNPIYNIVKLKFGSLKDINPAILPELDKINTTDFKSINKNPNKINSKFESKQYEMLFTQYYNLGLDLIKEERFEEAIKQLEQSLQYIKDSASIFFKIGECYEKLNNSELALESFHNAITSFSKSSNSTRKTFDFINDISEKVADIQNRSCDFSNSIAGYKDLLASLKEQKNSNFERQAYINYKIDKSTQEVIITQDDSIIEFEKFLRDKDLDFIRELLFYLSEKNSIKTGKDKIREWWIHAFNLNEYQQVYEIFQIKETFPALIPIVGNSGYYGNDMIKKRAGSLIIDKYGDRLKDQVESRTNQYLLSDENELRDLLTSYLMGRLDPSLLSQTLSWDSLFQIAQSLIDLVNISSYYALIPPIITKLLELGFYEIGIYKSRLANVENDNSYHQILYIPKFLINFPEIPGVVESEENNPLFEINSTHLDDNLPAQTEILLENNLVIPDNYKKFDPKRPNAAEYSFKTYIGLNEVKNRLIENLLIKKEFSDIAKKLKIEPIKGFLLFGPPGTGKSFFAQCIAGEFRLPMLHFNASTMLQKYVGDSPKNVKELFEAAEYFKPCILFIDETDKILPKNADFSENVSNGEIMQELLTRTEMRDPKIMIIYATNNPSNINPAIFRPGRISGEGLIYIGPPDDISKKALLQSYLSNGEKILIPSTITLDEMIILIDEKEQNSKGKYSQSGIKSICEVIRSELFHFVIQMSNPHDEAQWIITETMVQTSISRVHCDITEHSLDESLQFASEHKINLDY